MAPPQKHPTEDKPPSSLKDVLIQWAFKRFGYRGIIVILLIVSIPSGTWLLFSQYKAYNLRSAAVASQWLSQFLSTSGNFELYYEGKISAESSEYWQGSMEYESTFHSSKSCKFSIQLNKRLIAKRINGQRVNKGSQLMYDNESTYEFALPNVTDVIVEKMQPEEIITGQKFKFMAYDDPHVVIVNTGFDLLVKQHGKETAHDGGYEDFSFSTSQFEIPFQTQEQAVILKEHLSTSIKACTTIIKYRLCDDNSGC